MLSSKNRHRILITGLALLGVTATLFIALSVLNSQAITLVRIQLIEGQKEHLDKSLTLNKEEWLPDYQVRIRIDERWRDVGTLLNVSAKEGLEFPLNDPLPFHKAQEIQIRDKDLAENDILDNAPLAAPRLATERFTYDLRLERDFETGMHWFFETPVGKAVAAGIAIAVILVILAYIPL